MLDFKAFPDGGRAFLDASFVLSDSQSESGDRPLLALIDSASMSSSAEGLLEELVSFVSVNLAGLLGLFLESLVSGILNVRDLVAAPGGASCRFFSRRGLIPKEPERDPVVTFSSPLPPERAPMLLPPGGEGGN